MFRETGLGRCLQFQKAQSSKKLPGTLLLWVESWKSDFFIKISLELGEGVEH